ncbi:MAG TPA: hypothetical protein DCD99_11435 [Acinetobacter schindleri]|nr:hypothetical protein [Acinetobacter schindleri]
MWGIADGFPVPEGAIPMTEQDVDRIYNPEKYLSEEQLHQLYLSNLPSLTRRQFKLALLENNLLETIETEINSIADPKQKARIQIEYSEATSFTRTSESVKYMLALLDISEEQVNAMWESAATL